MLHEMPMQIMLFRFHCRQLPQLQKPAPNQACSSSSFYYSAGVHYYATLLCSSIQYQRKATQLAIVHNSPYLSLSLSVCVKLSVCPIVGCRQSKLQTMAMHILFVQNKRKYKPKPHDGGAVSRTLSLCVVLRIPSQQCSDSELEVRKVQQKNIINQQPVECTPGYGQSLENRNPRSPTSLSILRLARFLLNPGRARPPE